MSPVNHQPDSLDFPKAPLANEEDLEEVEKYETEVTKEKDAIEPKKEISVSDAFLRDLLDKINFENLFQLFFQPDEKKKLFRKYPYFKLEIHVVKGDSLLAMDRGGTVSQI